MSLKGKNPNCKKTFLSKCCWHGNIKSHELWNDIQRNYQINFGEVKKVGFSFKQSSHESQCRCFWPLALDSQAERVDDPSQIFCVQACRFCLWFLCRWCTVYLPWSLSTQVIATYFMIFTGCQYVLEFMLRYVLAFKATWISATICYWFN